MPKWDEIQKHASRIISEGVKLLKSGMSEAEYIAEATAESAKLHVTVRRNRFDMYKALHDLGQKVFDAASKGPSAHDFKLTDAMTKLISKVNALEGEAKKAEAKISKLSITKKGVQKSKKAPKTKEKH